MSKLLHRELTGQIIGAYYEVYNDTSRIYPEYIYEQAMISELGQRHLEVKQQEEHQVFYKDNLIGLQKLDLFVGGEVVVELKVVTNLLARHKAQTHSYVKTVALRLWMRLNYTGMTFWRQSRMTRMTIGGNLIRGRCTGCPRACSNRLSDYYEQWFASWIVGSLDSPPTNHPTNQPPIFIRAKS